MANNKKINVIIKEKTEDGFIIKHPQTNFKMIEDVPNHASISDKNQTPSVTTPHTVQVNASTQSSAGMMNSQVNASGASHANGPHSQINASLNSNTSQQASQINASKNSRLSSEYSTISAADNASSNVKMSSIIASKNTKLAATNTSNLEGVTVLSSDGFEYDPSKTGGYKVIGGYADQLTWMLDSKSGEIYAKDDIKIGDKSISKYIEGKSSTSIEDFTSSLDREINASYNSTASGRNSQVNASSDSTASGENSQVNTSSDSEASGDSSQVNASWRGTASGKKSQINASDNSEVSGSCSQVNASRRVYVPNDYCVAGGYGTTLEVSSKNIKWMIGSRTGNIEATGSITGNSSFADFAEYMESESGEAIPLGTLVSMGQGQKIKIAQPGEFPVGIISATAGIILNAQGWEWKDRYLYDRYGQPIYVETEVVDEKAIQEMYTQSNQELKWDDFVQSLEDMPMKKELVMMENPNHVDDVEYIPRSERPEWNVVGMKGQIYVNIDDTVKEGDFIQVGANGVATKGNLYNRNWLVMEVTTPYQEDLGHGIARVII